MKQQSKCDLMLTGAATATACAMPWVMAMLTTSAPSDAVSVVGAESGEDRIVPAKDEVMKLEEK